MKSFPKAPSARLLGKRVSIGFLALALLSACDDTDTTTPQTSGCSIHRVVDGDTVSLACPGQPYENARIVGYDTPEVFSPQCSAEAQAGAKAAQRLSGLLADANIISVAPSTSRDRYGRPLVQVHVDGTDVSDTMIQEGHASRYDGGQRQGWCSAG